MYKPFKTLLGLALMAAVACGATAHAESQARPTKPPAVGPVSVTTTAINPNPSPKIVLNCVRPQVEAIGLATSVAPGQSFSIKGCAFGKTPGVAALKGSFKQGFLTLDILAWSDSLIQARVPAATVGAIDNLAQVVVQESTKGLSSLEKVTIPFVAARDTQLLMKSDFDFACTNSSNSFSNVNCGGPGEIGNYGICSSSLCFGEKLNPSPDPSAFLNLNNHPTFTINVKQLKSGYKVKSHGFTSDSGADFFIPPVPVPDKPHLVGGSDGGDTTTFVVKASNNAPTGWYWFDLKVLVEGPKGVPYNEDWKAN